CAIWPRLSSLRPVAPQKSQFFGLTKGAKTRTLLQNECTKGHKRKREGTPMGTSARAEFSRGARDGLPIMLGYFAVSFTLGIAARNAGLSAFQAGLASFLLNA